MRPLAMLSGLVWLLSAVDPLGAAAGADEKGGEGKRKPAARSAPASELRERVFEVRHVDAEELARAIRSILALWGVERTAKSRETGGPGPAAATAVADPQGGRLTARASSPRLLAEIHKLVVLLDRDPRVLREQPRRSPRDGRAISLSRFRPGGPDLRGKRVDILDGEIPVKQLLRFLADYRGAPVILEDDPQPKVEEKITVVAPIRNADDTVVEALLERGGWLVERQMLSGEREVTRVSRIAPQGPRIPRSRRIIRVERE